MKFTLNWLKEHLETDRSLEEILDALTDLGLEVETVDDPASRFSSFVVGAVLEATQHPDADRLRVCKVNTGEETLQIICGAPNAREGIKVVVARPGTYVPGIDTTIQIGKIRGVESFGMMCSERELELSDEHDGIIELPNDAKPGTPYAEIAGLDDPIVEIAITPNRADALGVAGIARDLAARGIGRMKARPVPGIALGYQCPLQVSLDRSVKDRACPHFAGRMIRGVTNGPSPDWLQKRLRAIGLRPISTLVDITNFLTFDRNRPLHVFDADQLKGNLTVRASTEGESIEALDGKTYELAQGMTVIADEAQVVALGGVIGGTKTGCTDQTRNVFLEAAYFDPLRTATTGRALKINSDARYRFERGIDPLFTRTGLDIATDLILALCGGEASEVFEAGEPPDNRNRITFRPARVESLVGMHVENERQIEILGNLGFEVDVSDLINGNLDVLAPSWRPDIGIEADLVEEVARVTSLTGLVGQPLPPLRDGVPAKVLTREQSRLSRLRRKVAALGFNECVAYSFIDEHSASMFGEQAPVLANPISSEMSHLRPSLFAGLLSAAARNQARGFMDLRLFETGPVFFGEEPEQEGIQLSAIAIGYTSPRDAFGSRRPYSAMDAKGDAIAALRELGNSADSAGISRNAPGWFHPGRSGQICLGPKKVLASFGEIHPRFLTAFDIKGPAVGFTLYPEAVPYPKSGRTARPALDISDLQSVERDFAFVVGDRVEVADVVKAAQAADKGLITDVSVFDVFEGKQAASQLGEGRKSVAISVRLQPRKATLTDSEIEGVASRVVSSVKAATGASLRE